jgi:tetratricopeptide (TPR) repeat protein
MGIRKDEKSKLSSIILCLALVGTIGVMAEKVSFADNRAAIDALTATHRLPPTLTTAQAKSAVGRLEEVLAACDDLHLSYRIKYRIGVLHFRSHVTDLSKARFVQIARDHGCPGLIRMCSLNMIGQISRLEGNSEEALKAFNQIADVLEKRLAGDKECTADSAWVKLLCSALWSRAEIYETRHDYAAGIAAYNRLIQMLRRHKNQGILSSYCTLASDRACQLYLHQGDISKYAKLAESLAADYPQYYRTPLIKFEMACVKFLKGVSADFEFVNGSFGAPAQAIGYLKRVKTVTAAQEIADTLGRLWREHQNTYGGVLLLYHYAWLLDTLGEKEQAESVLVRICSHDVLDAEMNRPVLETFQEYAKIQSAIMLGEKGDYSEAQQVLSNLRACPDESHMSELAKSVSRSIEILKREVPKNVGE